MKDEYVIINKTAIEKRIEELEIEISYHHKKKEHLVCKELSRIKLELEELLSQSTPLIPEIEKAHKKGFTEGTCFGATTIYKYETSEDYISNLKLDIWNKQQ